MVKLKIGDNMFKVDYVCFARQTKIDLYLHSVTFMDSEELAKYLEDNAVHFKNLVSMDLFKGRLDSMEVNKHCYQRTIPIQGEKGTNNFRIGTMLQSFVEYNNSL